MKLIHKLPIMQDPMTFKVSIIIQNNSKFLDKIVPFVKWAALISTGGVKLEGCRRPQHQAFKILVGLLLACTRTLSDSHDMMNVLWLRKSCSRQSFHVPLSNHKILRATAAKLE